MLVESRFGLYFCLNIMEWISIELDHSFIRLQCLNDVKLKSIYPIDNYKCLCSYDTNAHEAS